MIENRDNNKQYVFFVEGCTVVGYDVNAISISQSDDKDFYNVIVNRGKGRRKERMIILKENCVVGMHQLEEEIWIDLLGNRYIVNEENQFGDIVMASDENDKETRNNENELKWTESNEDVLSAYDESFKSKDYNFIIEKSIEKLPYNPEIVDVNCSNIEKEAYYLSKLEAIYHTTKEKLIDKLNFNSVEVHMLCKLAGELALDSNVDIEMWLKRLEYPCESYVRTFSLYKIEQIRQTILKLSDFEVFVLYNHLRYCYIYLFNQIDYDDAPQYDNYYEAYKNL